MQYFVRYSPDKNYYAPSIQLYALFLFTGFEGAAVAVCTLAKLFGSVR